MISLLIVNYRSAALTARAIHSAREATDAPLQIVVVDNSTDPAEADALAACGADAVLLAPSNRGYAGGINFGRKSCAGAVIVASNPDVIFDSQALDRLAAAIAAGAAVAGPALFWDDRYEWHLPPADPGRGMDKLDEVLASRLPRFAKRRDARRIRRRLAFWSASVNTYVEAVSGAVMAIDPRAFDAAGGFDERFALYFEEIDFQRRLRELRRRVVYVPGARCRHLYNQSAARNPEESSRRFAESERKFLEKWYGPFAAAALKSLERPMPAEPAEPLAGPLQLPADGLVVEASPLPSFATAAGYFPESRLVELPADVLATTSAEVYLRAIDPATTAVVGRWVTGG